MTLECTCADIDSEKWDSLMKGARKCNYKWLVAKIKRELPSLYKELCLDMPNPYAEHCSRTRTHYILVWSATEYFIRKD